MNYWLIKSEPETWSWQEQAKKGKSGEMWDGVRNHQAANFLKQMEKGDLAFFYHSGKERSVVGVVEISRAAYLDPTDERGRFVAVTVRKMEELSRPVTLAMIKAEKLMAKCILLKQPRLSVMPISKVEWRTIKRLGAGRE